MRRRGIAARRLLADSLEHSGDYQAATAAYGAAHQYCDELGKDAVGKLCRACATAVLFSRGEWDLAAAVCDDVLAADGAPHARAVGACFRGLISALRGDAGTARARLLEASVLSTRIELTAVELLSAWGLAVLEDQAGARTAATDRLRQVLGLVRRTQERHYCVPVLQWAVTFFGRYGLADDAYAARPPCRRSARLPRSPKPSRPSPTPAARPSCRTILRRPPVSCGGPPRCSTISGCRSPPRRHGTGPPPRPWRRVTRPPHGSCSRRRGAPRRAWAPGSCSGDCAAAIARLGDNGGDVGGKSGGRSAQARAIAGLTARDLDVMRLVADGNTARQAGAAPFISPRTVEMHVQGCLLKLGCRTRAEAVGG